MRPLLVVVFIVRQRQWRMSSLQADMLEPSGRRTLEFKTPEDVRERVASYSVWREVANLRLAGQGIYYCRLRS